MRIPWNHLVAAVLVQAIVISPALSIERDRAEEFCRKEGVSKALRQTVILVDENVVAAQAGDDVPAGNRELIRLVIEFADPEKARRTNTFSARERLTVYTLPRDGSQPRHVFSGCQPFYDEEEITKIEGDKSSTKRAMDTFFGKGAIAEAEAYTREFKSILTRNLVGLGKAPTLDDASTATTSFSESSLISSLRSAPRLVNLHDGIPRIILLSNFAPFSSSGLDSAAKARSLGFTMAKQANIDFSRAEMYAVFLGNGGQEQSAHEYANAFFLGSGALLAGWSNKVISNLATNPTGIKILQGFIDYGGVKPPVRIRLAWDANGMLVSSWITVSHKRTVSTPMSGTMICEEATKCSVKSDDAGFAQVWSADPGQEAEYGAELPFSGLRRFEIDIVGTNASGKIWDPAVGTVGGKQNIPFVDLTVVNDGAF